MTWAQQPARIQLTEKDGLPDINFYNIIEDSRHFIWLAADNGLYRYDGKDYTLFTHNRQKGNAVFGTFEDAHGRVWCNNISGQFFYVENGVLELFIDLGDVLNGELTEFIVTPKQLIVLPGKNIFKVDVRTKNVIKEYKNPIFIGSIHQKNNGYSYVKGNYIIETDEHFTAFDSLKFDVFDNYALSSGISKRINIASNGVDNLCYFTKFNENVFYKYDFLTGNNLEIAIPEQLKPRHINSKIHMGDEFWFITDLGIFICTLKENELRLKKRWFKTDFTTKIIVDHEDNYWITTKGSGILVLPNIHISQYQFSTNLANISAIEKVNDSTLAFGTNNGFTGLFDLRDEKITVIDSSSAFRVSEILFNPADKHVIFTKEDKSFSYNLDSKSILTLAINIDGAKALSLANNGNYILSSYNRASILDSKFNLKTNLLPKRSYTNLYATDNATYVGGVDGLLVYNKPFEPNNILYEEQQIFVKTLAETSGSIIWAGTFKNGLFEIKKSKIVKHYGLANGLLSNKIIELQSDGSELWIATEAGIQLLNVKTGKFKNLTKRNGIPSYRISDIVNMDETVIFASNNGLFEIDKIKAFKLGVETEIYITYVDIGENSVVIESEYDLGHNENSIKIGFNVNGFDSFSNTIYEYRMLGQDDKWQKTDNRVNSVIYNSLPSGNYNFEVRPLTPILGKKINTASIEFTIASPFWHKWWFYVLIALSIAVFVYVIFILKIRKLKRKQTEILQKELLNKRLVFSQLENLRSQMNPHFIFNALNSIQEYIVLNEKDLASSYLIKFSRLIRIYLDHSREDNVWLSEEIKALEIYLELEKNRFEDLLDYTISVSEEIQTKSIKIPSLFIQPYVENALKHGLLHKPNDRQLTIIFKLNALKDALICSIEDNGIGIKASQEINALRSPLHKSFATNANEKRVELLNSNRERKITVDTVDLALAKAAGTRVVIMIPF